MSQDSGRIYPQVFHGCFEAVTPGCLNLDRTAFGGSEKKGSPRPAQVQVVYSERYPPAHWWLFENVPGLFYAGTNKVDQLLNEEQVGPLPHIPLPLPGASQQAKYCFEGFRHGIAKLLHFYKYT